MLRWEVAPTYLRVIDGGAATVTIRGERPLAVAEATSRFPRPVDETLETCTRELRLPAGPVSLEAGGRHRLGPEGRCLLPAAEHLIHVDASIPTLVRFQGAATLACRGDGGPRLSFPERTRVLLGFTGASPVPTDRLVVPDDPPAAARAISSLAGAHPIRGPDRSFPEVRPHPPLLVCGEPADLPARDDPDPGRTEVVVPPEYRSLFLVAPLAYYLGARLRTEAGTTPRVTLPAVDVERTLADPPALEGDVERLLRKTVFLDCLVRNAGPYETDLAEQGVLAELELDAEALYSAPPQQRLAAYLTVPFRAVEPELPEWPLATYVEPSYSALESLPFLLDRLSLLRRPETTALDGRTYLSRTLEDWHRPGPDAVADVDLVVPELRPGRHHGWLGEAVPIDVFKTTGAAYGNLLRWRSREREPLSIRVVVNGQEMSGEREPVAAIYGEDCDRHRIDLSVRESVGTDELARTFERPFDFVHFVGHCERDGLRCPDGSLATSSLDRVRAGCFFLNACGSYHEGMTLVERGSVAGAVTLRAVLNRHAVTVGSTFARLVVHGFSLERAMSLARRRIATGTDYEVVGDGTHALTSSSRQSPLTLKLEAVDGEGYEVTVDCCGPTAAGAHFHPPIPGRPAHLCGNRARARVSAEDARRLLRSVGAPVVYEDDLHWSHDLASSIADGR